MKRIINTLLVASCLLAAGCDRDDGAAPAGDRVPVRFGAGITDPQTRTAAGDSWVQGDAVGIFMVRNGQPLDPANIAESADNVEYGAQTGGAAASGFTPASGTPIFYPQDGSKVDFIAYYPYQSPLTDYLYPVDVSDQSDPAAIDVLRANTAEGNPGGYDKESGTVDLQFRHALSRLNFTLAPGDGSPDLAGAEIEIAGLATLGDMDLSDNGTVIPNNAGQTVTANTAADGLSGSAIVIPQTLSATKLIVTLADGANRFEWAFPADTEFQAGKNHGYAITVSKTGITVSPGNIDRWTGADDAPTPATATAVPNLVRISAGTFTMGSPANEPGRWNDEAQHEVTLTKGFYMSKYEITNTQYAAFLNAEGIGSDGRADVAGHGNQILVASDARGVTYADGAWKAQAGYGNHPVTYVTWYGAKAYADWVGGALPTEAQWEYACRAGSTTAYSYGNAANGDYMWYDGNSGNTTHEVGQKLPNAWGLYDMHGNVEEWCADWFYDYPAGPVTDPAGPTWAAGGNNRIVRGGCWNGKAQEYRSAYRNLGFPGGYWDNTGFRVVFPQ